MMLQKIHRDLPSAVSLCFNGAKRVRQTATALGKTGLDWILEDSPSTPVLMRKTFERMGATYIKIGQLIASSPSIFPDEYVEEFQRCLDNTEPVPFKKMKKILVKELGSNYMKEVFEYINPKPLASASIAQVYAAKLKTGEDVVIKIQRPGVKDILTTDLNFLYFFAIIIEKIVPGMKYTSLAGIISEIRRTVMEECDFIKEAENLKIFSDFLEDTDNKKVTTPHVYYQASTRRVLTMERFYGIPLTDRDQLLDSTDEPQKILGPAFETWMKSTTECKLFHADLHAGNILILDDGRVGFIDFGVVGSIAKKTRKAVKSLIESMIIHDFTMMAESMLAIGMTSRKVDKDKLATDLENIYNVEDSYAVTGPGHYPEEPEEPEQFFLQIVNAAEEHGIRFPREFTLLIKQFLYFDSYGALLFDMGTLMEEMMEKMEGFNDMLAFSS